MAGEFDPFSAILADEPTAQQMALARAAALRGQNFAGMVAGLAHEPGLQRQGPELMQQAQQGMEQLGQLPGQRMQQLLHQQALQKEQREAAPFTDPAQAALLAQGQQQAAKIFGGSIPAGASPSTGQLLLQQMEKAATIPKFTSDMFGRYNVHTGESMPVSAADNPLTMSPAALDQAAELFARTGQLPPTVRGKSGPIVAKQIADRAAVLHPEANLAENKATYKADTGSLGNQQKILDNAESWERTGKANLNVLLGVAQQLHDTGSPWLNQPVRTFFEKGIGDPNMTAFKAAHATVVNEYAKILSGSQGSGSVTEGARHEAESMLPLNATMEQLMAAAKVLDTDAGNRIRSARQQVATTKGRAGGKTSEAPDTTTTPPPPAPQQATPADTAALAWLKTNPTHAAASGVAAKLKAKGLLP